MLFGSESKCNRDLFCSTYLEGLAPPAELINGWVLEQVAAEPEIERVRQSIDMVMKSGEGDELTIYVARTVDGSECFARTRYLDISYYGDYQDAEPESVIDLLNHVTQKLADAEADGLEEDLIEKIFGPAPSAPLSVDSLYDEESKEGDSATPRATPNEGEASVDEPGDDSGNKLLGMLEGHDEEPEDA